MATLFPTGTPDELQLLGVSNNPGPVPQPLRAASGNYPGDSPRTGSRAVGTGGEAPALGAAL